MTNYKTVIMTLMPIAGIPTNYIFEITIKLSKFLFLIEKNLSSRFLFQKLDDNFSLFKNKKLANFIVISNK